MAAWAAIRAHVSPITTFARSFGGAFGVVKSLKAHLAHACRVGRDGYYIRRQMILHHVASHAPIAGVVGVMDLERAVFLELGVSRPDSDHPSAAHAWTGIFVTGQRTAPLLCCGGNRAVRKRDRCRGECFLHNHVKRLAQVVPIESAESVVSFNQSFQR